MCGIVGAISFEGNIGQAQIQTAMSGISHRGPDDSGIYSEENFFLGHTRLSIIDVSSNGHQPMTSNDGSYVIIFNGEIYNHNDIREKLIQKYYFKSKSDTETLLYGYIEYGSQILNMLNGIFAFAIFNIKTKELFIARDQFGVKPLYYAIDNKYFSFASELKAIQNFIAEPDLDYTAIVDYLNFLWCPGSKTPIKSIKKLLPGHFIYINNIYDINGKSAILPTKYYDIPFNGKRIDIDERKLIDLLDLQLQNAVKRQLLSDVPVGFFLSGGLDSSLIVAIVRKLFPDRKIQCFTINASTDKNELAKEGFSDDLYYAKKIATELDVQLEIIDAKIDIFDQFDKMIWHLDEPQADAAPLNVYNICMRARQMGYKVLIGGTAGDDLFSGYRRHQTIYYNRFLGFLPSRLWKFFSWLVSPLPVNNPIIRRAKKLLAAMSKPIVERQSELYGWLPLTEIRNLLSKTSAEKIGDYNPFNYFTELLKNIPDETDILNQMLYWEMKTFLVDHNLNYTDKMSMAAGVEVRVPYLDKELVEFASQIPVEYKMKGKVTKYILKKVAEKYLPSDLIYRPKAGFGAPVRKWITSDLAHLLSVRLSRNNVESTGIFDFDALQNLINRNRENKIDASYTILDVLAIDSWMQNFKAEK